MSSVTHRTLCTTCEKREAFYYRQSSGEKLCSVCLEESLENHVKHSFSKRVKLGKNPLVTTYIPTERILEGFLLSYMLTKIERRFGGTVSVVSFSEVLRIIKELRLNEYLERNGNVRYVLLERRIDDIECYTIKSLEKTLRNLGENLELIKDAQAVLLPYTLTDLNEAFLEHVILGVGDLSTLKLGDYMVNGVPLILPYAQVDRVDVIALSHALKFTELLNAELALSKTACGASGIIKDLVIRITLKHPELTRSMLRSMRFFSQ